MNNTQEQRQFLKQCGKPGYPHKKRQARALFGKDKETLNGELQKRNITLSPEAKKQLLNIIETRKQIAKIVPDDLPDLIEVGDLIDNQDQIRVLIVGINTFKNKSIPTLRGAAPDAKRLFAMVQDTFPDIPEDQCILLLDEESLQSEDPEIIAKNTATKNNIEKAIKKVLEQAKKGDRIIVAVSTHGTSNHEIVCTDTNPKNLQETTIPIEKITDHIVAAEETRDKAILALLDTCFAGGATTLAAKRALKRFLPSAQKRDEAIDPIKAFDGTGNMILAASQKDEPAYEHPHEFHGLFMNQVIKAFQERGPIQLIQMANNIITKVQEDADGLSLLQQPDLFGRTGDLKFPSLVPGNNFKGVEKDINALEREFIRVRRIQLVIRAAIIILLVAGGVLGTYFSMDKRNANEKIWDEIREGRYDSISQMTEMPEDIAEKLLESTLFISEGAELDLSGLEALSTATANKLVNFPGTILLNGLKELPEEVAQILETYQAKAIHLNGLENISPQLARHFISYLQGDQKHISLVKVQTLSREVIEILYQGRNNITFSKELENILKQEEINRRVYEEIRNENFQNTSQITRLEPEIAQIIINKFAGQREKIDSIQREIEQLKVKIQNPDGNTNTMNLAKRLVECDNILNSFEKLDLSSLKEINEEIAAILGTCESIHIDLSGIETIDANAANQFISYKRTLSLGLRQLSPEITQIIGEYRCYGLHLDQLEELDEQVARQLIRQERNKLSLNGCRSIDIATTQVLMSGLDVISELSLGITNLERGVVEAIAGYKGELHLTHLTSITSGEELMEDDDFDCELFIDTPTLSKELANKLRKNGYILHFKNLEIIDLETAKEIAKWKCIQANLGIRTMTLEVAQALKDFKNHLELSNLELDELPQEVGEMMGEWKCGRLILSTLQLTQAGIERLQHYKHTLIFEELNDISPAVARDIVEKWNCSTISLLNIHEFTDPEAERTIAGYAKGLSAYFLTSIKTKELIEKLYERSRPHSQWLYNVTSLTKEAMEGLQSITGKISLSNLKTLPEDTGTVMENWQCNDLVIGIEDCSAEKTQGLEHYPGRLILSDIKTLNKEEAQRICTWNAREITLPDIEELPEDVERALAQYQHHIEITHIKEIKTKELAEKIAASKPDGSYNLLRLYITSLTPGAAEGLKEYRGRIRLPRLDTITRDVASIIALWECTGLHINNITGDIANALKEFKGNLTIEAIEEIHDEDILRAMEEWKCKSLSLPRVVRLSREGEMILEGFINPLYFGSLRELNTAKLTKKILKNNSNHYSFSIIKLNKEVAQALKDFRGGLSFYNLREIDADAIEMMEEWQCKKLHIGIPHISKNLAEALGKYKGVLDFVNIEGVDSDIGEEIAHFQCAELELNIKQPIDHIINAAKTFPRKLTIVFDTDPTEEIFQSPEEWQCTELNLQKVRRLTIEQENALAAVPGKLLIENIESIQTEALARKLALSAPEIWTLYLLESLTKEAAKGIAAYEGIIQLADLETIETDVAEEMAQWKCQKVILDVNELTPEAESFLCNIAQVEAEFLRRIHTREFVEKLASSADERLKFEFIGHIDVILAEGLKDYEEHIIFDRAIHYESGVEEIIAQWKCKILSLKRVTHLDSATIENIQGFTGELDISNLQAITNDAKDKLNTLQCSKLIIGRLTSQLARDLAVYEGHIACQNHEEYSQAIYQEIIQWNCKSLTLQHHEFQTETEQMLSQFPGNLYIRNIWDIKHIHTREFVEKLALSAPEDIWWDLYLNPLPEEIAKGLAVFKGYMRLIHLEEISESLAAEMAHWECEKLHLISVKELMPQVERYLANIPQIRAWSLRKMHTREFARSIVTAAEDTLDLTQLREITDEAAQEIAQYEGQIRAWGDVRNKIDEYRE